jgi:hypothetical protein
MMAKAVFSALLDRNGQSVCGRSADIVNAQRLVTAAVNDKRVAGLAGLKEIYLSAARTQYGIQRLTAAGTGDITDTSAGPDRTGYGRRCASACKSYAYVCQIYGRKCQDDRKHSYGLKYHSHLHFFS